MAAFATYLRLVRPANVVTSIADVLAGIAISGLLIEGNNWHLTLLPLCISTACLYAGGIVFNDVFDLELDRVERPERALPSGQISAGSATMLGALLLLSGVFLSFLVSAVSGGIALSIAVAALIYNRFSKHHPIAGPLNMGLCRGLNLLLGISAVTAALFDYWFLGIVPLVYIFSITMISRGEVHGGSRATLYIGGGLYLMVILSIGYFSIENNNHLYALPFLAIFAFFIFRPLAAAISNPIGPNIGRAVKAGVISLILADAAWAMAAGRVEIALFVTCLLPISLWLAKRFAVT